MGRPESLAGFIRARAELWNVIGVWKSLGWPPAGTGQVVLQETAPAGSTSVEGSLHTLVIKTI